jgi:kojibiose phosphorylase
MVFMAENYSGSVLLESRAEQVVRPEGTASFPALESVPSPSAPLLKDAAAPEPRVFSLSLRTVGTGHTIGLAFAGELQGGEPDSVQREIEVDTNRLVERWALDAEIGETYRLDRLVSIHTSRDTERPAEAATKHLERLLSEGVESIISAHVRAWEQRWHAADVEVEGDEMAQRALRFACYHLVSASDPEDERVSIGARSLTGRAYQGHVFWDTEIYMLPFYLLTHPPSARSLLKYRYHTLGAAREKARAQGYQGAYSAWESADTGEEVTPPFGIAPSGEVIGIRNGEQEIHIGAAVAYAVFQYWHVTGDERFLLASGAEIMLETARFWASRGEVEADGHYHIRHVIGPDEYHEDVDDNAYTNLMAQWNLEQGAELARLLEERWPEHWRQCAARLGIDSGEVENWKSLAAAMYTGFDPETGLFEQFQGYFDLEEIDLAAFEPRTTAMDVLLGRERIQRSKVIRQADVVMAVYLLWDRLTPEVRDANFRYYEPRTGHGSSLSPGIHALVAARLGELELAEKYFRQAAEIDLADNMGNAAGGVHVASLGALWQAAVFGFGGLRIGAKGPSLDPYLPSGWRSLHFPFEWRGRIVRVTLGGEPVGIQVQLEGEGSTPVELFVGEHQITLISHRRYRASRRPGGWNAWQEVQV